MMVGSVASPLALSDRSDQLHTDGGVDILSSFLWGFSYINVRNTEEIGPFQVLT